MDDYMAASEEYYKTSRFIKRQIAGYRWRVSLAIFLVTLLIPLLLAPDAPKFPMICISFFCAALFALIAPSAWMRSVRRQTLASYKERANKIWFCEREIEITPDGIAGRSIYGESLTTWGAIERIEATSDYTFLYMGAVPAFIIPNKRIPESDLREFLSDLKTHFKPDHTIPLSTTALTRIAEPIKLEPVQQTVGIASPAPENNTEPAKTNRWYVGH
jgi:hypothetical protein